eukprot:CAMPEP_0173186656 /NCGR_PEP_ID=MMETSP1141-20130122/10263_1 /TAXON_ID=483371 /ORGANISM="non described non described, Strain CCMP2298" /LENGTH=331 /DNA_ID=CAMNT_0014110383 /DNA_START=291 /DNA_END=1286 /DNA_ORIENTATION=+
MPGAPEFDHGTLFEYHVLWTNQDGTLRKSEVLNNDNCTVKLLGPGGRVLSICESHIANPLTAVRLAYESRQQSTWGRRGKQLRVGLRYARLLVLLAIAILLAGTLLAGRESSPFSLHLPAAFVVLYWTACACDLLSREASGVTFGVELFSDRLSSLLLCGALICALAGPPTLPAAESVGSWVNLGKVNLGPAGASKGAWPLRLLNSALGLSSPMVCAALLLEFAAFAVFWALPSSGDAWRQQPKDLYLHVAACSPALLSSLCLASEYYVLHCHSSYFYEFPWDPSSRLSCLWLLLVALGCAAFYCRILNNVLLAAGPVLTLLGPMLWGASE